MILKPFSGGKKIRGELFDCIIKPNDKLGSVLLFFSIPKKKFIAVNRNKIRRRTKSIFSNFCIGYSGEILLVFKKVFPLTDKLILKNALLSLIPKILTK